jgi:hypothetical protein
MCKVAAQIDLTPHDGQRIDGAIYTVARAKNAPCIGAGIESCHIVSGN